jgi:predicted transposase YdaD
MTSRPHDALFKAAFEHPDHAAGLLRSILPESIAQVIEWNTLTHRPGSFIDPDLADTHSDLLFSARVGAHEVHIYMLFEHLSTQHPEEPRRMLRYLARWQRFRCWRCGCCEMVATPRSCSPTSPIGPTRSERPRMRRAACRPSRNCCATWVCPDLHYQEFRETIRRQLPESEETVMTIAEQLIQQGRAEGRAEGRIEGRAEGRVELLEQQILEKFGTLPSAVRERLASATDEQFARYSRRVLRAQTLDAMLDD